MECDFRACVLLAIAVDADLLVVTDNGGVIDSQRCTDGCGQVGCRWCDGFSDDDGCVRHADNSGSVREKTACVDCAEAIDEDSYWLAYQRLDRVDHTRDINGVLRDQVVAEELRLHGVGIAHKVSACAGVEYAETIIGLRVIVIGAVV